MKKLLSKKMAQLDKPIPIVTPFSFWMENQRPRNHLFLKPLFLIKDKLRHYIFRKREKIYFVKIMHSKKSIFFNIPKNGSTSVNSAIKKHVDDKRGHINSEELERYGDYFKFSIVRNPYDRLYSAYCNFFSRPTDQSKQIFIGGMGSYFWRFGEKFHPSMSFKEFIYSVCSLSDEILDEHVLPQHKFITNDKGALIVDSIIKLENLEKEIQKNLSKIGIPCKMKIPKKNKTVSRSSYKEQYDKEMKIPKKNKTVSRSSYKEQYDKEMSDKVYERYKKDFELLGYKK